MHRAKILLVEDEEPIILLLTYNLQLEDYTLIVARDGDEAVSLAINEQPDLILLDWMLPNRSGLSVCKTIRKHPALRKTPVIMLTAKGEERDVATGLQAGADDYVRKPFSIIELKARIETHLRRVYGGNTRLEVGSLRFDLENACVFCGEAVLALNEREFFLLYAMAQKPGQVFEREKLIAMARESGVDFAGEEALATVVRRLRRRLKEFSGQDFIRTARGVGYIFEALA